MPIASRPIMSYSDWEADMEELVEAVYWAVRVPETTVSSPQALHRWSARPSPLEKLEYSALCNECAQV